MLTQVNTVRPWSGKTRLITDSKWSLPPSALSFSTVVLLHIGWWEGGVVTVGHPGVLHLPAACLVSPARRCPSLSYFGVNDIWLS